MPTNRQEQKIWKALDSLAVVLLATLAVSAQERQIGRGLNYHSREKEAALGAQLAQEVQQRTTPLDSTAVHDFVEQIEPAI